VVVAWWQTRVQGQQHARKTQQDHSKQVSADDIVTSNMAVVSALDLIQHLRLPVCRAQPSNSGTQCSPGRCTSANCSMRRNCRFKSSILCTAAPKRPHRILFSSFVCLSVKLLACLSTYERQLTFLAGPSPLSSSDMPHVHVIHVNS
jgi:hypothetical protein